MKDLIPVLGVVLIMSSARADNLPDFDSLWDYNNPAQSEAKFRDLLPVAEKSGDTGYLTELQTQIARTLSLQQKFDEAHAVLDEIASTLEAVKKDRHSLLDKERRAGLAMTDSAAGARVHVRYLLERGRTFNSSKQKDSALPLFEEAWNVSLGAGLDSYAVDAAHMMAIAAPPEQVMELNQKALALAEKSSEPKARKWRGSLYNNIGWDYFGQAKYDSALAMFEKAVRARIEQEQQTEVRVAKWCVAKTLRMMGQVESALLMQQTLEIEWRDSDDGPDGYAFEEIAECLLALNRANDAAPYFARAHELLSGDPWLQRDEPERLARLKELGGVK